MKPIFLSRVAELTHGRLVGEDTQIGPDVVIDSRLTTPGALFIALPGEHVDGHGYVGAARERGAAAAMVTHPVDDPLPQIVVADGPTALKELATAQGQELIEAGLWVIGITGSSGKTTTKDMTAAILERAGATISPPGSFNNELGMPLTVLRCDASTRYLVAEMGAQRRGEIAMLCSITQPDIGVILNVGQAHLGEFGGLANIAEAKSELVRALAGDGWAVLNYADPRVWGMRERTVARVIACAVGERPNHVDAVWAEEVVPDALERYTFTLRAEAPSIGVTGVTLPVTLPLVGRHLVADAVQAAAAALCARAEPEAAQVALSELTARSRWRMALTEMPQGFVLINDAYNANPESVRASLASLRALRESRGSGRTWAVLGDMLELGDESVAAHRAIGELAREVDEVVAVGEFGHHIIAGAGKGRIVASGAEALDLLRTAITDGDIAAGDIVLLKGSNSVALGPVGDALVEGSR